MFCLVSITASTYSQNTRLDVSMKDGTMVDLIQQIEENSEFFFYYQKEELKKLDQINLEAQNATIMDILDKVLAGTSFDYSILDRYIVVRQKGDSFGKKLLASAVDAAIAQQRTVSGTVTDAGGQPLPGVTVVVKGTTKGTITDTDGNYSLSNVPEDATLIFSFVGMRTQEVVVSNQTTINITMEAGVIGIEEVVAIGYGTVKRSDLTGAVATVQGDLIAKRQNTEVSQALQGAIPGVMVTRSNNDPGSAASIRIRGITTIGNSNPLIIVDGVPVNNINDVNPNDITDISVLKDAASASIYGSRAAAGVILVTTKRAKLGEQNLTYNYKLGIEKPTEIPHLPMLQDTWKWQMNNDGMTPGILTMNILHSQKTLLKTIFRSMSKTQIFIR